MAVGQRVLSRLLDEVIGIGVAFMGSLIIAIPGGIVYWGSTLISNDSLSSVIQTSVGVIVISIFVYLYVWAVAERASNSGQSVGMSVTNMRYVSNKAPLRNPFLKFVYRWAYFGQKESDSWAGDEGDDVGSLLLFRRFFFVFVLFSSSLFLGIMLVLIRIPILLYNLVGGNIDAFSSIPWIDYPIFLVVVVIVISSLLGPLLIFTAEGKTLSDHFFGVQMIQVSRDEKPSANNGFWNWFWKK